MSALKALSRARAMLAEADTVEAAQDVAKMAKVAEELARQADLGVGAQNEAVLVRAHAYAKAADLLDADPDYGPGKRSRAGTIPRTQVMRYKDGRAALNAGWHLEQPPDHELTWPQIHREGHRIRLGTDGAGSDEYYTPPWLFDALGVTFDLDVAAPDTGRTVPARTYYTQADDGVTQPWHGMVWCNPPYSAPEAWAQRFTDHGNGIWLSLLRNGKWLIPLLDAADTVRIWVQPRFVTAHGGTQTPPGAHVLAAIGPAARHLAAADLGDKVSQPL